MTTTKACYLLAVVPFMMTMKNECSPFILT